MGSFKAKFKINSVKCCMKRSKQQEGFETKCESADNNTSTVPHAMISIKGAQLRTAYDSNLYMVIPADSYEEISKLESATCEAMPPGACAGKEMTSRLYDDMSLSVKKGLKATVFDGCTITWTEGDIYALVLEVGDVWTISPVGVITSAL